MANTLYNKAAEGFLQGTFNWNTNTLKVVPIDTSLYTFDPAHQFLSDIPAGTRVAISGNLASKTSVDGSADAADITLTAVSGASVEAIAIFKDTGTPSTSNLIYYADSGTNLPVTPNGGDIIIEWDNGANKIFKI